MRTTLCEIFSIDVPVFAFSHCRDVVVEVSKAGGFGVLGIAGFTLEQLEKELCWIDEHIGDKPYGVDLLIPGQRIEEADIDKLKGMISEQHQAFMQRVLQENPVAELPEDYEGHFASSEESGLIGDRPYELLEQALTHDKVSLYVNALGSPSARAMEICRKAGVKVAAMAGKVKHAVKHKDVGVDLVIAVGGEAAGHTGDISTMVLTPQIVEAVAPLPVLAAGGIASGKQIAAAMALGADGAWTGSVWLPTQESELSAIQRQKIVASASEDTIRSRCMTGKPVRMMKSRFTEVWEAEDAPAPLPFPLQPMLTRNAVERYEKFGVEEMITYPAGQVIGQLQHELSVKAVVLDMMEDYLSAVERLSNTLAH